MPAPSCRTCHADLPGDANCCPACGTPVHGPRKNLTQTVPLPTFSTEATPAHRRRPWGAVAALGGGAVAMVVALVIASRPPAPVVVQRSPAAGAIDGVSTAPPVPPARPPTPSEPPVVLRMVGQPPPLPAGAITAGSSAGSASSEPFERTVTCSRAVKLKVDPDETEVEVDGVGVGSVESLHDRKYRFDRPGIHRLRLSSGGRSVWVRVVVEEGAEETATIKLDLD